MAIHAVAATIYVPDNKYSTIQAAVAAAHAGDTIIVGPGTYTERVTIKKDGITITSSSGSSNTIISVQGADPALDIYGQDITLTGLTVRNIPGSISRSRSAAIIVHAGARIIEISDCDIRGGAPLLGAIHVLDKGRVNMISNSIITANGWAAIYAENNSSIGTIENCDVHGLMGGGNFGIRGPVALIDGSQVTGNVVLYNGKSVLRGNIITGSVQGATLVEFNNITGDAQFDDIVRYNTIDGCIKYASSVIGNVCGSVVLVAPRQSRIEDNLIRTELATCRSGFSSPGGILVDGGTGLVIQGNILAGRITLGYAGHPSNNVIIEHNRASCISTSGSKEVSIIKNTLIGAGTRQLSVNLGWSENVWVYLNNILSGKADALMWESTHHFESITPLQYEYNGHEYASQLGNYWGTTVNLEDSDDNGIGDTPVELYCPAFCAYDHFPLVRPANFYLNEPPMSPVGCRAKKIQGGNVVISWANPADMDLQTVRVVRRLDRFPQGPFDGTQIATFRFPSTETKAGAYVQITDVALPANSTGYYAVFVQDFSSLWNTKVVYGVNAWKVAPTGVISPPAYRDILVGQLNGLRKATASALESYTSVIAEMIAKSAAVASQEGKRWIDINTLFFLGPKTGLAYLAHVDKESYKLGNHLVKTGLFALELGLTRRRNLDSLNDLVQRLKLGATDWKDNYAKAYNFIKYKADLSVNSTTVTGTESIKQAMLSDLQALQASLPGKISVQEYLGATKQLETLKTALLTLSERENVCIAMDRGFIGGALWTNYRNYNIIYAKRERLEQISGVLSWATTGLNIGKLVLMLYTGGTSAAIEILLDVSGSAIETIHPITQGWLASVEDVLLYLSTAAYADLATETTALYNYIATLHTNILKQANYKNIMIKHVDIFKPTLNSEEVLQGSGEITVRNDSAQGIKVRAVGIIRTLRADLRTASTPIGIAISSPCNCPAGSETPIPFEYQVLPPKASGTCTYLFSFEIVTAAALPLDVTEQAVSWSSLGQAHSIESEVYSGTLAEGKTRSITISLKPDTAVLDLILSYGGSNLDLHVYDSAGNHVGLNYNTMTPEVEIPGASFSGTNTLPEIVRIKVANPSASYTVRIVGRSTPPGGDPYALLVVQEGHVSAIPSVQPDEINVDTKPGETIPIAVNLLELGQQIGLKGISTSTSTFQDSAGTAFPGITWRSLKTVEALPPGGTDSIFWEINLPKAIADGTYTGQIRISGEDASTGKKFSFNVPVHVTVGVKNPSPPKIKPRAVLIGPNPVPPEGCIFWLNLPKDAVKATLKVFDVDGAELVTIPLNPSAHRYPATSRWIPKDHQGRLLGTGLYLYCVEIKHADGTITYSPVQKMVIKR